MHKPKAKSEFGLGVFFANPSSADFGVRDGVCGGSSLPGTR
jgi:hypothetical protein